ncbi:hypothetical protein SR42_14670 [Clostridium botulinum]|uniref:DUF4179 domain-containing protein n=1 Tax=Clostridium botulinum TaxID=1491 RepID=UPI000596F556|nr:DUF4179 domain-containing protein [Clostridium botulinum]KIL07416.1 hypothetical protein SR42_14670 [Clostridium botulinum]MBY6934468.1 DUF4179 domain-containing protein [Clostridium botulinum]NFL83869.1 DUF4179 domain-containing protein [Clostridium botulinum]NFN12280.1 DUF4179 domain-containing protein [Clostridium botulinum]NFO37553.1 DUF4179 domain-containing protein [Clostridium botulinum]
MLNKKLSQILEPILGVMVFITSLGLGQVKALADDNVSETSVTCENKSYDKEENYSVKINKSVEQNGLKITLDSAIATKHKLKILVKVESKESIDKEKADNLISIVTFGGNLRDSSGYWNDYKDDKTFFINIDEESDEEEFLEKGNLRVDIVIPTYKINVGIDADVDFSKSFKESVKKDVKAKIPEFDFTVDNIESDIIRTTINYSGPWIEDRFQNDEPSDSPYSCMILQVGDKMYKAKRGGSSSSKENGTHGTFVCESLNYDKFKESDKISIIPLVSYLSYGRLNEMCENEDRSEYYKKINNYKEIKDNVKYLKSFDFYDGSKGEIYNIERNDNKIKVYCKGNTEKAGLLMVTNIFMDYQLDIENVNYSNSYESRKNMSFYKDLNDEFGYVVEFNNVPKDKTMDVNFDFNISKIDKYEIGKEVELSK